MTTARLRALAEQFPPIYHPEILGALDRTAFQRQLVVDRLGTDVDLCDLGAGNGFFAAACAQLGMRATVVDDYQDNAVDHSPVWRTLESLGVSVQRADIMASLPDFAPHSLDAVTLFDVLEHLHASPRGLLHRMREALRPGGLFVIAVPNAVNLRKRVAVALGRSNWSHFAEWYDKPVFRSHVREPVVADLLAIARDLALTDVAVYGRNFAGSISTRRSVRLLTRGADLLLRRRPSLCSDLYLVGRV